MFERILACTDGSEDSLDAVEIAATLAKKYQAALKVLSVFSTYYAEPAYMGVWAMAIPQETIDECAKAQSAEIEKQVQPVLERHGISGEIVQEMGHPVDCIVDAAKREHSDLVVIGSRGMGAFDSFMLGSVSDGVLHHAPCPVLVTRGKHERHKIAGFQRILLTSDGSQGAGKAASTAIALAQKFAVPLTVLNVFEPSMPLPELPIDIEDQPGEGTYDTLDERVKAIISHGIRRAASHSGVLTSFYQEKGNPAESIIRFADQYHFDLIVMGSRGLGTFKGLLLGSVSDRVAHHAHCPILVVR